MPFESDIVQACLHRRVLQQAERTPARVAVRCGEQALNYAELARRVNALARLLRERGVRGETPVGVLLPRTIDLPAALLGVMAAGGAYVPLDPAHPAERINFILDDIAAPFVITTTALAAQIDLRHAVPLCLDALESELAGYSTEDGPEMSNVAGLAYVIFTSGSTGRPKGVMIEHRNVNCMLAWAHAEYSEHELSRVVAATSITFDLSVFEIFAPLTMGGAIDIIDNGLAFATSAGRHAATLLNTVPSVLRELLAQQALPEQLKVINLAGEPLPLDLVRQIYTVLPHCRVYNLYGPSEDTTYSTGCVVPPDEQRMTVGRPLLGRHLYLLDASGAPVIPGEEGEIHVGGPGVTRGYWNRAALSASVFLPDPQYPGRAMYRTGDFGRQLADGRIEFLGRRDDQIKLRGFRIELGEIEMTLRAHSAVAAAAVVGMDSDLTGPYLRCAIEASADVNAAALAAWSASRLPAYMVPTDWHILAQMPLLPNGKTDRNAIRALARQSHAHARSAELSTEQAMLAALWQELLGVRPVHPEDSFFALGGHSILAVRLARRIADTCGAQVDAVALLRHPTLAAQAALLPSAARTAALQHRQDQRGPAPATPAQQRYWTLESLQPGGCRYNIAYAWRFAEAPDWRQLDQALCAVLRNATALRTVCVPVPAGIAQQVVAAPDTVLQTLALNGEEDAHRQAAAFAARPFQLEREIPLRALAINVAGGASLLVIVTHHIAADGSAELIQAAVAAAYRGESLPPGTSSIDAAGWLHGAEHGAAVAVDQRWWAAEFSDPPQPLALPADRAPAAQPRGQGGQVIVSADAGMRARLTAVCAEHAVTPFHALLALSWAYLARLCGQDDICVAVPVTDRPHPALSDAIGCFVNTVLMRGQVNLQSDIATLLRHARERALAAQAHSRAPIDRVVGANACLRMGHGGIVANVMLSVLQEAGALTLGSAHGEPVDIELPASRFDLSMFFRLSDDGIRLVVEYDGERFDRTSARRIGEGWMTLARAALADPGLTVGMLPLLTPAQRGIILDDWNATTVAHASVSTLHGMFLERAQRQPDAVAIRTDAGELSYAELAAQAALMAQCVLAAGARPGNRVAVLCDRQPYLVASLLGIMMAGCVYVPLDPDSPLLRHQAMLDVAGARLLVSDAVFAERARALAAHTVLTTIQADAPVAPHAQRALPADDVERLAYIIFTSGSTGTPKAVAVRHRPAYNLIDWVNRTHRVGPGDCLLFVTSVSFDLSVYDMFGMLAAGGTIRIAGRASVRDPQALARILVEEDVTFWDSAPIALDQCVPYLEGQRARALRLVFLSGDWVPVTLPDRIRACADAEVVALGGATEAVIWSNWHPVGEVQPGQTSIPYGRPIQNARYHILDHRLEPVPVGVAGDLYIGGDVLADGYYGDPALTAQRFIADPFGAPGQRLYRTGDRARYFADGSMEFLGRLDNQVKIRGYRIETSEIETALAAQVGVRAAHVAIRGERQARWLCAYVVTDTPDEPGLARRLAAALRARLPEYMLPRAIVPLAALPLNSSGKVDRARLPEPQFQSEAVSTSAAPITLMDKRVLAVWQEVLGRQDIGPDDNFFDVGGDSARLIATHRALESLAQRKLPLVDLFRHTTVRGLSAWLGATTQASAPPPAQRAGGGLARVAALRKSTRSPSTTKET